MIRQRLCVCLAMFAIGMVASATAQWSDDFDSYATGSQVIGQGGWNGWDNNAAAGGLVSGAQSQSAPNSIAVVGSSDLVRPVTGANSGQWLLTADMFVPADYTGISYFILMNTYVPSTPAQQNWSLQMEFRAATNIVANLGGSGNTTAAGNITVTQQPLVRDQWVPIEVLMDFDNNTHVAKYNGNEVVSGTWAAGTGSNVAYSTVDLFANTGSVVYYDNLNLQAVPEPSAFMALGIGIVSCLGLRRRK